MVPSQLLRTIFAFGCGSLLVACATPYKTPAFESRPPGQTTFPGIAQLVVAAPNHTLDVLMVHGMCTHGQRWAEESISQLNSTLSGVGSPTIVPVQVEGTKATLYQANLSVLGGVVRTSALVWSPIVAPLKNQLCYDQKNKSESCKAAGSAIPAYPYKRAVLNREFKDTLMNDCLADAIIYQGKARDAIIEQLQKAMLTAAAPPGASSTSADVVIMAAASASAPLVLITESLGSKMAFDAIYKLVTSRDKNESAAGIRTFDRTTQVFMGANQMPILALADQRLDGSQSTLANSPNYPKDALAELIAMKRLRTATVTAPPPRVVAFTDPNDLLSYILAPAKQVPNYDVVDVIVSNDNSYLGFLENPYAAHTSYLANIEVRRLIACGTSDAVCVAR